MKVPSLSSIPTKPADYESLDGLRDKVAAAPRYGANGKYLILQAARLVAQKESCNSVEHNKQGMRLQAISLCCLCASVAAWHSPSPLHHLVPVTAPIVPLLAMVT